MNGPFEVSDWSASLILDASGNSVAYGYGDDEATERKNTAMACAALNAAYYMALATKEQS